MKRKIEEVSPKFVEHIPERLVEGVLYISERFRIATHLCCCGCGEEIATPLSPVEWRLIKDGNRVSLHPSIGNWGFACKSHYWIKRNRVEWATTFNARQIAFVQQRDQRDKARYVAAVNAKKMGDKTERDRQLEHPADDAGKGFIQRVLELLKKWIE